LSIVWCEVDFDILSGLCVTHESDIKTDGRTDGRLDVAREKSQKTVHLIE